MHELQFLTEGRSLLTTQRRRSVDSSDFKLPYVHQHRLPRRQREVSPSELGDLIIQRSIPSNRNASLPADFPQISKPSSLTKSTENTTREEETLENKEPEFPSAAENIVSPKHSRNFKDPEKEAPKPTHKKTRSNPECGILLKKEDMPEKYLSEIKEWVFWEWIGALEKSFGLYPKGDCNYYKYYIGKGNNSNLVNQMMKSRWWWHRIESPSKANFVWTQLKHKSTIDRLSTDLFEENGDCENFQVARPRIERATLVNKLEESGLFLIKNSEAYKESTTKFFYDPFELSVHNKLPNNKSICSKKSLLKNMMAFYIEKNIEPFSRIPLTFHVKSSEDLEEFYEEYTQGSIWIVKPGEGTNRGHGITVTSHLSEIESIVQNSSEFRTHIVQKYIQNPLLIHKRKFDIRCYGLVTCLGTKIQGFFYKEGYIRTATKEFSLKKNHDKFIHLTNDAIQKKSDDYGKNEPANKMSYNDFERYLHTHHPDVSFEKEILPEIQEAVADSISAVHHLVDDTRNTFEVFGYDFMVDEDFKVWLIEVNTNPCLELSCSYLAKLIPAMINNAMKITLDPIFPPPVHHRKFKEWVQEVEVANEFVLVFSSEMKENRRPLE